MVKLLWPWLNYYGNRYPDPVFGVFLFNFILPCSISILKQILNYKEQEQLDPTHGCQNIYEHFNLYIVEYRPVVDYRQSADRV